MGTALSEKFPYLRVFGRFWHSRFPAVFERVQLRLQHLTLLTAGCGDVAAVDIIGR